MGAPRRDGGAVRGRCMNTRLHAAALRATLKIQALKPWLNFTLLLKLVHDATLHVPFNYKTYWRLLHVLQGSSGCDRPVARFAHRK